MAGHVYRAVDLRRVPLGAALSAGAFDLIEDHLLARADLALEPPLRNGLLALHEAMPAVLFDLISNGCREIIAHRAGDRLVAETADAIELRLIEPVEQEREIVLGFAWEADD